MLKLSLVFTGSSRWLINYLFLILGTVVYKVFSFSLDQIKIFGSNGEVALITGFASGVVFIFSFFQFNLLLYQLFLFEILLGAEKDVGS